MECSCEIDVDVDWSCSDFCREEIRIARKKHKCFECGRTIEIEEKYEYVIGKWDGHFDSFKTCCDCLNTRNTFFTSGYYYGQIWEFIDEFINEADGDIPEDCISTLTPRSRDMVCKMIEDTWGGMYDYDEEEDE